MRRFVYFLPMCCVNMKSLNFFSANEFLRTCFGPRNLAGSMVYVIHSNDFEAYFHARGRENPSTRTFD